MRIPMRTGQGRRIRRTPLTAIAYRRVSTERQGESGIGLEGQRVAIEAFAQTEGYEITEWYQDVASGYGESNTMKRPGLMSAIERAKALNVPLLVNDASRVSRMANQVLDLAGSEDVEIISVTQGALVNSILASSAARAEHERRKISEHTKQKLQQLKAEGVRLGNPTNLADAQRKGAEANRSRGRSIAERLADVLQELGGGEELSAGEIVIILNDRDLKTGSGQRWTKGAIRRPLALARQILKERSVKHYADNADYGRF